MNLNNYVVAYDNGGFDRYTLIFKEPIGHKTYMYVKASENPGHPQGFWQHGEIETKSLLGLDYLGKMIEPGRLPKAVKDCLENEIASEYGGKAAFALAEIVTDRGNRGIGMMIDDLYVVTNGYMAHAYPCIGQHFTTGIGQGAMRRVWQEYRKTDHQTGAVAVLQTDELKRLVKLTKGLTKGWASRAVILKNGKATVIAWSEETRRTFVMFEIKAAIQGHSEIVVNTDYLAVITRHANGTVIVTDSKPLGLACVNVSSGPYEAIIMGMNMNDMAGEWLDEID